MVQMTKSNLKPFLLFAQNILYFNNTCCFSAVFFQFSVTTLCSGFAFIKNKNTEKL